MSTLDRVVSYFRFWHGEEIENSYSNNSSSLNLGLRR